MVILSIQYNTNALQKSKQRVVSHKISMDEGGGEVAGQERESNPRRYEPAAAWLILAGATLSLSAKPNRDTYLTPLEKFQKLPEAERFLRLAVILAD